MFLIFTYILLNFKKLYCRYYSLIFYHIQVFYGFLKFIHIQYSIYFTKLYTTWFTPNPSGPTATPPLRATHRSTRRVYFQGSQGRPST
jgi:hypothetical protein